VSTPPAPVASPSIAPRAAAPGDVHCSRCDAVCCRLTVVLLPDDAVPAHLTAVSEHGLDVMARDEDGWCVALDAATHRCTIYDSRPELCRKFAMGGPYCLDVRADYADRRARGIPLTLY
jgi:Fe-S-cluster containining protein